MPIPLALALLGAGTIAKTTGQQQIGRERGRLGAAERERQRRYGERASEALNRTITALSDPTGDYETAARTREAAMVPTGVVPTTPTVAVPSSAPEAVKKAMAKTLSGILTKGRGQIRAGARVGAGGAQLREYQQPIVESGREIGMMTDFARGSQRALQSELEKAQEAGTGMMTLGDILSGVGTIYGLGGFTPTPATAAARGAGVGLAQGMWN